MSSRLRYPELAPEGYTALTGFGHYVNTATALEPVLLGLVYLRASILNGCHFCTEVHKAELRKHHEPESRIDAVGSGPATDAFTPREQAALRWTELLTRLGDQGVSDGEYAAVNAFFEGKDLVDLSFAVANINAWNRMGVAFQPQWRPRKGAPATIKASEQPVISPEPAEEAKSTTAPSTASHAEDDDGKVATD